MYDWGINKEPAGWVPKKKIPIPILQRQGTRCGSLTSTGSSRLQWGIVKHPFPAPFMDNGIQKEIELYGVDALSIGNRYTVRGFDGEYTLMGESGWYLRNELSSNIPTLHSDIYLGLDVGSVYGVSTDVLVGRTIAGMALGLRGNFSSGLSYDAFISRSLYKPEGYHTKKWVPGFTVSWKF